MLLEGAETGRDSTMDFSTGSEVPSEDVAATVPRTSKTVDARAFAVTTDESRDALL